MSFRVLFESVVLPHYIKVIFSLHFRASTMLKINWKLTQLPFPKLHAHRIFHWRREKKKDILHDVVGMEEVVSKAIFRVPIKTIMKPYYICCGCTLWNYDITYMLLFSKKTLQLTASYILKQDVKEWRDFTLGPRVIN